MASAERPSSPAPESAPQGASLATVAPVSEPAAHAPGGDVLFVAGPCEQGGHHVLRHRGDRVEVGMIRDLEHGRPVHGEVVRLHRHQAHDRLFDVEVLLDAEHEAPGDDRPSRHGPAQVATNTYRKRWELVFGAAGQRRTGGATEPN